MAVFKPPGECAFGDCNHPASIAVGKIRACSHEEPPTVICHCCYHFRKRAFMASPCSTCGTRNHISLYYKRSIE